MAIMQFHSKSEFMSILNSVDDTAILVKHTINKLFNEGYTSLEDILVHFGFKKFSDKNFCIYDEHNDNYIHITLGKQVNTKYENIPNEKVDYDFIKSKSYFKGSSFSDLTQHRDNNIPAYIKYNCFGKKTKVRFINSKNNTDDLPISIEYKNYGIHTYYKKEKYHVLKVKEDYFGNKNEILYYFDDNKIVSFDTIIKYRSDLKFLSYEDSINLHKFLTNDEFLLIEIQMF